MSLSAPRLRAALISLASKRVHQLKNTIDVTIVGVASDIIENSKQSEAAESSA